MEMKGVVCRLLETTSRTFLLPIMRLPGELRDAVGQAYLCLRAIDEIEDHPDLDARTKAALLRDLAAILYGETTSDPVIALRERLQFHASDLPEVTLALPELAHFGPLETRPLVWESTAEMADAMASWAERGWRVVDETDLDQYTFDVAGRVGLLLSRLWRWFDGTETDEDLAVGFGRALQTVNIIRNRVDDASRGVNFHPDGWDQARMFAYARRQLAMADAYMQPLIDGPIREFCAIPLELARATLAAIDAGREKLSRSEVEDVVGHLVNEKERR